MQEINVTELRNHLPKYLHNVQRGTEILVTLHGKVIARLLPPFNARSEAQKTLVGLRKQSKVIDVVSPLNEAWDVESDNT